jgi:hypothetical protein
MVSSGQGDQLPRKLVQPVRVITKSTVMGMTAAAFLIQLFHEADMKCAVRVVQRYSADELDTFVSEEYPSIIFIDCIEQLFYDRYKQKHTSFLKSTEVYKWTKKQGFDGSAYAHFIVLGMVATHIDYGGYFEIPDVLLQDALQSGALVPARAFVMEEATIHFIEQLIVAAYERKVRILAQMFIAAARLGRASSVIATLLGDTDALRELEHISAEYRDETHRALEWCKENENSTHHFAGVLVVHARDYIASYLTGAVAAHLVKESGTAQTLVLVLSYTSDNKIRVALRMAGNKSRDMASLLHETFEGIDGECGGDMTAAGGSFPRQQEEKFLSNAKKVLEQAFVEEAV